MSAPRKWVGKLESDVEQAQSDVLNQLRLSLRIGADQFYRLPNPKQYAMMLEDRRLIADTELVNPEHGDYPALYELCHALLARLEWAAHEAEFRQRPWWMRWFGVRRLPRPVV